MASERARPGSASSIGARTPRGASFSRSRAGKGGRLKLRPRRPLREGVLAAFRGILSAARTAAREAAADSAHGVHEFRKSLRRARALVTLLRPAIGGVAARGLARELRDAFQTTGSLRDAEILVGALASVPRDTAEDGDRLTLQFALQATRDRKLEGVAEVLAKALPSLRRLPAALDVVLPPDFDAHDLERGLSRMRRRERAALERARESGTGEDVHLWRKRVKDLRYALELLASTGSRELQERERTLADLARRLGTITDWIALAKELERVGQPDWEAPAGPVLLDRVRRLIRERAREILEDSAGDFEEPAHSFARRVIAERG